jgi:hypothetical protein
MRILKKYIYGFKIYILSLFLLTMCGQNCALLIDEIQFKVFSTVAGFTGYYIVEDKEPKHFEDDNSASGDFSFSKNAGELKYIEVNVENKANATSLKIKIYRNGVKVKEASLDNITGTKTLNLTYRFKEEENAPTKP